MNTVIVPNVDVQLSRYSSKLKLTYAVNEMFAKISHATVFIYLKNTIQIQISIYVEFICYFSLVKEYILQICQVKVLTIVLQLMTKMLALCFLVR